MPVAVVTGASAGVGRATVRRLAAEGYDLGLIARGRAGLAAAAEEVRMAGGAALELSVDVADAERMFDVARKVEHDLGPIDVWVNNAMTTVFGAVEHVTAAEIRRATEVTYLGQVHGTLAALEQMRPRDRGRIVNVGSSLAFVGIPLQAAYCGAKFAVRGFTESVRAELIAAGSGVRLSQVHLPALNTPQFDWCESKMDHEAMPVAPIYDPDIAAEAILRAAHEGSTSKVVGTWNSVVVRLAQGVPGVLAHYAARTGIASQQTEEPERRGRPSNLWEPVDDDHDAGATGSFDQAALTHGPSFLLSLPRVALDLTRAIGAEVQESARTLRHGNRSTERDTADR